MEKEVLCKFLFKPPCCGKGFKNNTGYGLHKLTCWKNDTGNNSANVIKPTSITENVELIVKNTVNDMVN